MPSGTSRAWVMDIGGGRHVAAGTHHVVEYLLSPETLELPLAPPNCPAVLIWRERIVPAVDLVPLLPRPDAARRKWSGAVILPYQQAPGKPLQYGALLVYAAPQEVWVSNGEACSLPEQMGAFAYFACACFAHEDEAIPVLDSFRLFSEPPPWLPPPEDRTGDAISQTEATPAPPAEPEASAPRGVFAGDPAQEGLRTEPTPPRAERDSSPADEATGSETQQDGSGGGTDTSPRCIAIASESPPPAEARPAPVYAQAAAWNRTSAAGEPSPEDHPDSRRRRAQQIIVETLAAIRDEAGLERVLFGVLARDRGVIQGRFFSGVAPDSPLRRFRVKRAGSTLFARLVQRPQHVWVNEAKRHKVRHLIGSEMQAWLGDVAFCASSVFVRSKLVGICYGDAFPSVDGLDEHRYQQFKSLCTLMATRLAEIT
jgi:chemotaxis signal transduction protein